ncbi:probable palmitoyltransferase ZDHHC11 isoform X3 [Fukomys damarensis]|uniref:probable palmitoyltransferase ZDHHC11 isoform X3 n=1 Tax=Fukomys damarensis TaxID=885580 RepID=UPI00053F3464|nr:probable palmitoyltransferase ZDHHC11 isoform X3 [Fukomys damarensis]
MDLFSRSLRRVFPETQARGLKSPPRHLSRVNGWSLPLHPFQAVAWATYLALSIVTFGIVIPLLPGSWKYIAYSVTAVVFLFHLVVHLSAVTIDPAEANVRLRNYSKPVPTFDRSQHAHVIQNLYCHLCEVTVNEKAKHCSSCNKCVAGFDHHCKWLNNCVGSRNYCTSSTPTSSARTPATKVRSVWSASRLGHPVRALTQLRPPFQEGVHLQQRAQLSDISAVTIWLLFLPKWHVAVKTPVALCMMGGVLLVGIVSFLLLGHLFIFHIYLMVKNKSTFDYVKHTHFQQRPEPPGRTQPVLQVEEAAPQVCACPSTSHPRRGHRGWTAVGLVKPTTSSTRHHRLSQAQPLSYLLL